MTKTPGLASNQDHFTAVNQRGALIETYSDTNNSLFENLEQQLTPDDQSPANYTTPPSSPSLSQDQFYQLIDDLRELDKKPPVED